MSGIKKITTSQLTWINIVNSEEEEISFLREHYKFHPLDLKESYGSVRSQRPKLDDHKDYLFLVLHFPIYHKKTRRIQPEEIDFFVGKNFLITIHNNELIPLKDFFKICFDSEHYRERYLSKNPSVLLYEILDRLLYHLFPMLDHMGEDIEKIEKNIFGGNEKKMLKEILLIKRNITNFRKIMQSHKTIIKKLIAMDSTYFPKVDMGPYYHNLIEETKDIWEILETQKETIDALHQTNETSISFKLNDIMKTLTIFSVIVFPLTLIASIFGMNTQYSPFVGHPNDFWIIMGIMASLTLFMYLYFKLRKWI